MKRKHQENVEPDAGACRGTNGPLPARTRIAHDGSDDRRDNNNLEELVVCPISLQRMRDPVVLVQSGITYDRENLCQSLLHFPTKDPKSNVDYDAVPLQYAPNYSMRAMLTALHGDEAFKEFDDTSFQTKYNEAWENLMLKRLESSLLKRPRLQGEKDEALPSFEVVRLLAQRGHPLAQIQLGLAYDPGHEDEGSVPTSFDAAKSWYRMAAEQGHPHAQYNLGLMYDQGQDGVEEPNLKLAARWYRKAAKQGNINAQFNLGNAYDRGKGVEQNFEIAVKWWEKAAKRGDTCAQYSLGCAYDKGKGVKQSLEMAVELWQKAAKGGNTYAQHALGYSYFKGEGVKKSSEMAVEWWEKAAERGHVVAQFCLGCFFEHRYGKGTGVPQENVDRALKWYQKAADQGDADARDSLQALSSKRGNNH